MKLPKHKYAADVDKANRRLENPLTEAQKAEIATVEAERRRNIQRAANRNSERLRAKAERRSVAGGESLAGEASRLSTGRKSHPLAVDEKAEKARLEAERRSAAGVGLLAAEAIQKAAHRKLSVDG